MHVIGCQESDEFVIDQAYAFVFYDGQSPLEVIDERQHILEDTLTGSRHEVEFLFVGTLAVVIELRHHPQVLILQLRNALLERFCLINSLFYRRFGAVL